MSAGLSKSSLFNNMKISQKSSECVICDKKGNFLLQDFFRLLSNVNRFRIFCALVKYEKLSDRDINDILAISKAASDKHLKALEEKQILLKKKQAAVTYYFLNKNNLGVKIAQTAFINFNKN